MQASRLPVAETVPLFATLLSLPVPAEQYPPLNLSPQRQRQQTHDLLVAWLVEEAERQPVQVTWEDVHWADPSTLEVLGLVIEQAPTVRMLNLLTYRPEFQPPWPMRSHMTPLTLNRLERLQVEALVTHLAGGKVLPAEVMQHVVSQDRWGAVICRGADQDGAGIRCAAARQWALRAERATATLRDSGHSAGFADGPTGSAPE